MVHHPIGGASHSGWQFYRSSTPINFALHCVRIDATPGYAHDDYPVGRYVILPEHINVFIGENNTSFDSVADWVAKWKGYVTRRWRRFSDRPIWQRSFWDRQILGAEVYESKWIYVHLNPVRHGLVKDPRDWPFQGEKVIFRW